LILITYVPVSELASCLEEQLKSKFDGTSKGTGSPGKKMSKVLTIESDFI